MSLGLRVRKVLVLRQIDGRKCWYAGKTMISKSLLQWPAKASVQAKADTRPVPVTVVPVTVVPVRHGEAQRSTRRTSAAARLRQQFRGAVARAGDPRLDLVTKPQESKSANACVRRVVSAPFDGPTGDHPGWRFEGFDVEAGQIFDLI